MHGRRHHHPHRSHDRATLHHNREGWTLHQRDGADLHVKRFLDLLPGESFQESTWRTAHGVGMALAHSEQTAVEIYADMYRLKDAEKSNIRRLSPRQWSEVLSAFSDGDYVIVGAPHVGGIVWGAKVSTQFRAKVVAIGQRLQVDPNYLMACMAFESAGTFSPSKRNAAGSGAVGLIQFMRDTAIGLRTDTHSLAAMSAEEQLDYVERYFWPYRGRLSTLEDVYMVILYPIAVGKPGSHVLFTRPSVAYDQNAGLDANEDGVVTKDEAAAHVRAMLVAGERYRQ
jgi:hypothetical protein